MTADSFTSQHPSRAVAMVTAQPEHISQLLHWFGSQQEMFSWGGPGMQYPTNQIQFLRDIGWLKLASIALVPENEIQSAPDSQLLMGFAQIYPRQNCYHFGRVAISPNDRGKGLGEAFLQKLMQGVIQSQKGETELVAKSEVHPEGFVEPKSQAIALPFKADGFSLFVLDDNTPAINCYKKLGFEVSDYPGAMPGGLRNCVYMVRSV